MSPPRGWASSSPPTCSSFSGILGPPSFRASDLLSGGAPLKLLLGLILIDVVLSSHVKLAALFFHLNVKDVLVDCILVYWASGVAIPIFKLRSSSGLFIALFKNLVDLIEIALEVEVSIVPPSPHCSASPSRTHSSSRSRCLFYLNFFFASSTSNSHDL